VTSRDDDALTLQTPSGSGVTALQSVLDLLKAEGIGVEKLSMHTPDLDDVFLALTGHRDNHRTNVTDGGFGA
jgi:ABC-2 type transport system ATP-binding protein